MELEDRNEADKLEMSQEEFSAIAVCPCVNDDMHRLRKGWATREPSLQVSELVHLSSNNQSTQCDGLAVNERPVGGMV